MKTITFIWMICLSVGATTNYYSFTDGNDANDGLTIATCKKIVPGMIGAGAYSHSPSNDIFVWKAGDIWPATYWPMTILCSGTNNIQNPDSYRTNGSWGTGLAFGQASHSKSNMFIVANVTNIEMIGLDLSGTGGSVMNDNSGIVPFFETANFNAYYCHFHDWLTTATGPGTDTAHGGWIGNSGNVGWGFTNIGCHYCEIDNIENGPSGKWNGICGMYVGVMDHCLIHDNGSGILFGQDEDHCETYNIDTPYNEYDANYHENGFYMDGGNWTSPLHSGVNIYCRSSTFHDCGGGANMAYPNIETFDCYVYNCLFYGVQTVGQQAINIDPFSPNFIGSGSTYNSSGNFTLTGLTTGIVYSWQKNAIGGNDVSCAGLTSSGTFTASGSSQVLVGTPNQSVTAYVTKFFEHNCYIYNNTVVLYDSSFTTGILVGPRLKSDDGGTTFYGQSAGTIIETNNHFIGVSASVPASIPPGYTNFAGGGEYIGVQSQLAGNNIAMTPTTATADGYTLGNLYAPTSASNPTVGAGANLASIGLFSTAINGVSRGSNWDVGAYQFAGGSGPVLGGVSISGGVQIDISVGGQLNIQ